jgi:hypothetical protein
MQYKGTGLTKVSLGVIAILLLLSACLNSKAEKKDLFFFYLETCPSCEDYILADKLGGEIALLNKGREWNGGSYNVASPKNKSVLQDTLADKDLPDVSRSLPILIIGNEYLNGYEAIKEKIEELSE